MNIALTNSSVNRLVMPISQAVTLTSSTVYFLFRLTDYTTNTDTLFTAPDISTNIVNYNEFEVTLTGSAYTNLTAGTINLHSGAYQYEVYQMTGQTNLDLSGVTGGYLKTGLIYVEGPEPEYFTETYSGMSTSYSYYTPF